MVWTEQNLRLLHETLCNCDDVPTIFKVMAQHGISAHRTRIAMHDINNQTMKWNVGTTAIFTAMLHQIRNSSDDVIISNITTGMAWYGINARKTQSKLASCGIHTEVYKERQRLIAAKQRLQTAITALDADMSYDVKLMTLMQQMQDTDITRRQIQCALSKRQADWYNIINEKLQNYHIDATSACEAAATIMRQQHICITHLHAQGMEIPCK